MSCPSHRIWTEWECNSHDVTQGDSSLLTKLLLFRPFSLFHSTPSVTNTPAYLLQDRYQVIINVCESNWAWMTHVRTFPKTPLEIEIKTVSNAIGCLSSHVLWTWLQSSLWIVLWAWLIWQRRLIMAIEIVYKSFQTYDRGCIKAKLIYGQQ